MLYSAYSVRLGSEKLKVKPPFLHGRLLGDLGPVIYSQPLIEEEGRV